MKTIFVVTEGPTETNFVKFVLSSQFSPNKCVFIPTTVVTKTDHKAGKVYKGGITTFEKAKNTIINTLKQAQNSDSIVTTMFDYYGLPSDTPGMEASKNLKDPYKKVEAIENEITNYFSAFNNFLPYIQLHEFESLIFTSIDKLKEIYFEDKYDLTSLYKAIEEIKNPELINNSYETAPSKRILSCIPDYDKITSGIEVLLNTDFQKIRNKCQHFDSWIKKLEELVGWIWKKTNSEK